MSISASEHGSETEEERERERERESEREWPPKRGPEQQRDEAVRERKNCVKAHNNMCFATQALLRKYAPILIIVGAFLFLFWLRKKIYG
jgi:hypothetical protein